MIPRWLTPAYWRAESRLVESMANPDDHSWDRVTAECDRCSRSPDDYPSTSGANWVYIIWREDHQDFELTLTEELLVVLCPEHAQQLQAKIRRAVAEAVRS